MFSVGGISSSVCTLIQTRKLKKTRGIRDRNPPPSQLIAENSYNLPGFRSDKNSVNIPWILIEIGINCTKLTVK